MVRAFIALGSNLGDSKEILRLAMQRLKTLSVVRPRCSSLWRTTPVDCPPGSPPFFNAVVAIAPAEGETPESLLARLQAIEREFGRHPKRLVNEPRPLDLDLIAFGRETRAGGALVLPHPRAHLRRFVLAPLNEIAPELVLPGQSEPVRALLEKQGSNETVERVEGEGATPGA
jgi:2-amino-4-hydroxy-6-hydroxymethyldihydropteridine diphosphokinase